MKMTQTELMDFLWETIRSKKNCDFELGRKAAIEAIRDGLVQKYRNHRDLVGVHGPDWVNGFWDYVKSWENIHQA